MQAMAQMQRPQPVAHHSATGLPPLRTRSFGRQPAGTRARRHCAALRTRASPTVALGDSYKEESRKYRRAGPRITLSAPSVSRATRSTLQDVPASRCVPALAGTVFDFDAWARHRSTARYVRHMTEPLAVRLHFPAQLHLAASCAPCSLTSRMPSRPGGKHSTRCSAVPGLPVFTPHPRSQVARGAGPAKTPVGPQVEDSARPGATAPGGRWRRDGHLRVRDAARGAPLSVKVLNRLTCRALWLSRE